MIVGKGEGRAWGMAIAVLALGMIAAWWWLSREAEPLPTPVVTQPDAAVPGPPTDLPRLATPGSLVHATDPIPADVLRLLLSTPEGMRACVVRGPRDGLPLEAATCGAVDAPFEDARLAMAATEVEMAWIGGGEVTVDGARVWEGDAQAVFARGPRSIAVLTRDGALLHVDGEATARFEAPVRPAAASPALVWDRFLWLDGARVHAKPALEDHEAVEVGQVPENAEHVRGCKSGDALAVIVDGPIVHGVKQVAVTFADADGWSAPVGTEAGVFEYQISCRGREVALTWLVPGEGPGDTRRVVQARCTPGGCEKAEGRMTFAGSDPHVADLAGEVLVVWAGRDATHARLAPLVELDIAPNVELLPQPEAPVLSRHLFVRGGAAVLVHRTRDGLFATRIDAGGRAAALPVRERGALSAP